MSTGTSRIKNAWYVDGVNVSGLVYVFRPSMKEVVVVVVAIVSGSGIVVVVLEGESGSV